MAELEHFRKRVFREIGKAAAVPAITPSIIKLLSTGEINQQEASASREFVEKAGDFAERNSDEIIRYTSPAIALFKGLFGGRS